MLICDVDYSICYTCCSSRPPAYPHNIRFLAVRSAICSQSFGLTFYFTSSRHYFYKQTSSRILFRATAYLFIFQRLAYLLLLALASYMSLIYAGNNFFVLIERTILIQDIVQLHKSFWHQRQQQSKLTYLEKTSKIGEVKATTNLYSKLLPITIVEQSRSFAHVSTSSSCFSATCHHYITTELQSFVPFWLLGWRASH